MKHGDRLVEGKVPETCEAAGLQAVCTGPDDGCQHTDTNKCMVTPLSTYCINPMFVSNYLLLFSSLILVINLGGRCL